MYEDWNDNVYPWVEWLKSIVGRFVLKDDEWESQLSFRVWSVAAIQDSQVLFAVRFGGEKTN
jgi:hypothetical protein